MVTVCVFKLGTVLYLQIPLFWYEIDLKSSCHFHNLMPDSVLLTVHFFSKNDKIKRLRVFCLGLVNYFFKGDFLCMHLIWHGRLFMQIAICVNNLPCERVCVQSCFKDTEYCPCICIKVMCHLFCFRLVYTECLATCKNHRNTYGLGKIKGSHGNLPFLWKSHGNLKFLRKRQRNFELLRS